MKMRRVLLLITVLCFVQVQASTATPGVAPTMANGIASWSGNSAGYNVRDFLSGGINSSNCIGFQAYDDLQKSWYFISDQQIPALKAGCVQQGGVDLVVGGNDNVPSALIPVSVSTDNSTWSAIGAQSFEAASIPRIILQGYKPGSIVQFGNQYYPLSTPFKNTAYNMLQLHPAQITKIISTGGTSALTAQQIESIPYYYLALSQVYMARVATAASGLSGLFSSTPVMYNNQPVNNNTIYMNFMQQAKFYLQVTQYALASLGLPNSTGSLTPYAVASQQNAAFSNQSGGGVFGGSDASGFSNTSSGPALTQPGGNNVASLLDTFMGVVLINNVNPNGTNYNVGFGSSNLQLPVGANGATVQPTPFTPPASPQNPDNSQGLAFYGFSAFIPVAGSADNWVPTQNGYGRAVGINYTIAGKSPIVYGAYAAPFNFSVALSAADTTNNTIVVYNNANAEGTPIATLNLANFFALPTPWALVVEANGCVTNTATPTVSFAVVPSVMAQTVRPLINQYLTTQANAGATVPQDVTTGTIDISQFLCQNNQLMTTINQQPELKGVIKLNPYDFPLQFTHAGPPPSNATAAQAAAYRNMIQPLPTMTLPLTFSMANVFDSSGAFYNTAFPPGYHADITSYVVRKNGMYKPYAMGYLILQGLMNGYLMMSTVNAQPNSSALSVPLSSALQQPVQFSSDLAKNLSSMSSLATTYQQPSSAAWFATAGFDYLFIRSLMVMRGFTKALYLTKYAVQYTGQILKNPNAPYPVDPATKLPAANAVYFGQNRANNYNVFIPVAPTPALSVSNITLCPSAQTNTNTTNTTSSNTSANSNNGGGW